MNTTALRAYHGDPAIKAKYINRIRAHRAAEHLTQGIGWEDDGDIRGCAVGCTLDAYDHSRYPIELGLPEWLAYLEDAIFEGLPADEAQTWPESFLEAIQPGADVEPVRHQLALRRIDRLIDAQNGAVSKHDKSIDAVITQTVAALRQVRRCHEAELGGNTCDWSAAELAAELAAESARSAESARQQESSDLLELLREVAA